MAAVTRPPSPAKEREGHHALSVFAAFLAAFAALLALFGPSAAE